MTKPKSVWIANQPTRKLLSEHAADFTGANPVVDTGTNINENSKVYSKYVETPVDIGSNAVKRPAWREKKFNEKSQDDTEVQSTS